MGYSPEKVKEMSQQRPYTPFTPTATSQKPTLQEFLEKAKSANPDASEADLTDYYNKKYGG